MNKSFNAVLASLVLSVSSGAMAAESYQNWAGPYVGIFAGSSHGENKSLGTGAGTSSGSPGAGVCLNTASGQSVSGQTEASCGNGGVGNPFVFIPSINPNASTFTNDLASASGSRSLKGFKIGYNWQKDRLVYGVEADYRNIDEETLSSSSSEGAGAIAVNAQARLGLDSMLSARGRLGYLVDDRFLPYVTAGLASGRVSTNSTATYSQGGTNVASDSFGDTARSTKFIYGVGADFKVTNNLLLGVNLLWVDFGTQSASDSFSAGANPVLGAGASVATDSSVRMFSAGLSWLFN
jgi:opacity protein-like surface antigen